MRVAVLMTCYNRVDVTLDCLRHLYSAIGACPDDIGWDVWLNDDGSTDGTSASVMAEFPQVRLLNGSGRDFWCGGMRRAWQAALSSGVAYDGYLWLNDDTLLYQDALRSVIEVGGTKAIAVGVTCSRSGGRVTYGGRDRAGSLVRPTGARTRVYGMNGNCVYVPHEVFKILGNFPSYLTHALGDFDYAQRACRAGVLIYQTPEFIGECDDHDRVVPWKDPHVAFTRRLRNLYSPVGGPEPSVFFKYNYGNFGLLRAVRVWLQQHVRLLFPGVWTIMGRK